MSTDKSESLSEIWGARFDDRDDEELACQLWARSLASREQAMAQPFKNFPMADEVVETADKPDASSESAHAR